MKKNFSGSWILFSLVLVLGAYTYYSEIHLKEKNENLKLEESKIFFFAKDQVQGIQIRREKEKIILNKTVDGWNIVEPVKDIADNEAVESFVSSLVDEKTKDVAKEGEGIDEKTFGFGPSSVFLSLQDNAAKTEEVEISSKKNFEGNPFLRLKNKNKIFVGAPTWASWSSKKDIDFRDKRFFRGKVADAEEIQINNFLGEVKLVSESGKWKSSALALELLDQNRVRDLLSFISSLKVQDILTSSVNQKEKEKFGWNKSEQILIRLKLKDKVWSGELSMGKDKSSALGANSFPGHLSKIDKLSYERFRDLSLLTLRDHRWPFDFDKSKVTSVEYGTLAKKTKLIQNDKLWSLVAVQGAESQKDLEVQSDKVKDLIDRLKVFEVTHFLSQKSKDIKDFKNENFIRLSDKDGQTLIEFFWGPSVKKKWGQTEQSYRLGKTSRSQEIFAVEESNFGRLDLQNLVKKKEQFEKK